VRDIVSGAYTHLEQILHLGGLERLPELSGEGSVDGIEVTVDVGDLRRALAVEPVNPAETASFTEAAE
jgi:hypothetical protein